MTYNQLLDTSSGQYDKITMSQFTTLMAKNALSIKLGDLKLEAYYIFI